ncbi:MAG: tetratricopeptide repeat protein [Alphaproteobacteria bacterium]
MDTSELDRLNQEVEQARLVRNAAQANLIRVLTSLVVFHVNHRGLGAALPVAREAHAADPGNQTARNNLRVLLDMALRERYQAGDLAGAAMFGEEVVEMDPDSPDARRTLGICLMQISKLRSARQAFAAWRQRPDDGEFYNTARNVFKQMTTVIDRDFVADRQFYKALITREESYEALIGAGRAWEGDDFGPAAALLRRAIALVPDAPFAYLELASMLGHFSIIGHARKFDEARWCFERVQRFGGTPRERMIRLDRAFHEALPARVFQFKSPLEGELGTVDDKVQVVVFVSCDPVFFRRYWASFSEGLLRHLGDNHFHLHIMNPDPEFLERELPELRRLSRVSVSFDRIATSRLYGKDASYYASNRLMQIPEILAHYQRTILFLDIDIIIKGPVADFVSRFADHDISVPRTPAAQPGEYVSIDIMVLNHSVRTLDFLRRVARYIDWVWSGGGAEWLTDQTSIYSVLFNFRETGRPFLLQGLHDEDFVETFHQIKASTPGK